MWVVLFELRGDKLLVFLDDDDEGDSLGVRELIVIKQEGEREL